MGSRLSVEDHGMLRAAISGAANLLGCDLEGNVQRITYDVVDKEPAELEAFADAVANGVKFVIAPEEIVNTVA